MDNWRIGDIPTAQIFGAAFVLVGIGILVYRRRSGAPQLVPEPGSPEAIALEEAEAGEAAGTSAADDADDEDFDEFDEFDAQVRSSTRSGSGGAPKQPARRRRNEP